MRGVLSGNMYRDEDYFLIELQKDEMLYNIFNCIAEYSTTYHDKWNWVVSKPVQLKDVMVIIKSDVAHKSDSIIQDYIDTLIRYGLCHYVIENDKNEFMQDNGSDINDSKRLEYYKDLGYPKENTPIKLTTQIPIGCSGESLYSRIIKNRESEISDKKTLESINLWQEGITKPVVDRIEKRNKEIDDKITEMNRAVDSGIIKNIQVISVFAGIITILFANIMGIKEFSNIGVRGLLILNSSMVIGIFSLILFTKLLIVGGKIERKAIFYCFLLILFITIPTILWGMGYK